MKRDVSTLEHLSSNILHLPLPQLLKECVPACMVLILTNYAQQGDSEEESQERRQQAAASHDLLNEHLTQEVKLSVFSLSNLCSVLYQWKIPYQLWIPNE